MISLLYLYYITGLSRNACIEVFLGEIEGLVVFFLLVYVSDTEDYKPVMQRWSSQRQRYRPCPDAPGWPAISSCSPGARQPRARQREPRGILRGRAAPPKN